MTIWNILLKSFYSFAFFRYSRLLPVTKTIVHVLLIIVLVTAPPAYQFVQNLQTGIAQLQTVLTSDIPPFEIEAGTLQTPTEREPYVDESLLEGVFILDGTGSLTQSAIAGYSDGVALLQNEAIFIVDGQLQQVSYLLLGNDRFTNAELFHWLDNLEGTFFLLATLAILIMYIGLAGLSYIGISLLAVVGLFIPVNRSKLAYKQLWSMAAITFTLPTVSFSLLDLFVDIPLSLLLVSCLSFFLYTLLSLQRKPKKKKLASI